MSPKYISEIYDNYVKLSVEFSSCLVCMRVTFNSIELYL